MDGTTFEMTSVGQYLTRKTKGMDWEQARPFWDAASDSFARGAMGAVHVVQNADRGASLASAWARGEYKVLKGKGNAINYYGVTGGKRIPLQ